MTDDSKKELLLERLFPKKKNEDDEDGDQNFIKKGESQEEVNKKKIVEDVEEIVDDLQKKSNIRPQSNQQRNLDRETGGLEAEEQKESGEKDVWDDRSEEVDRMGSVNAFQKGSIKSMIWRYKKKKLDEKKEFLKDAAAAGAVIANKKGTSQENSVTQADGFQQQGYIQRVKTLRQDRGHEIVSGQSGGAYR